VTPTMSTQRADGNCSEISANCPPDVRERSRSDHGNLGRFLGATGDVERDDGSYQLGLDDDAPGPFESQQNRHRDRCQRVKLAHPPIQVNWFQKAFLNGGSPLEPIAERNDGLRSLGWHGDAPGPFTSRAFAAAVAARQARQGDIRARQ
jgi:hypothetical protein